MKRLWLRCLEVASRHPTKIRFLLVGALNTTIGLTVYPGLSIVAGPLNLHYLTILIISQLLCLVFTFLTQKFLVFRTNGNYLKESGKFLIFHTLYFLLNLAVLPALVELGGMNPIWAQTLFAILIIVSSYFWHSHITFSSSKVTR